MRVLLVTGMSGSGKSIVLHVLEDAGFSVVDNLPPRFLVDVIGEMQANDHGRVAVSVDVRAGLGSVNQLPRLLPELRRRGYDVQILFLTANTPTLVQRYSETRRRHPLSTIGSERTLAECIDDERELLASIEGIGHVIDTSDLPAQTLRTWVRDFIGTAHTGATLLFESFAFKDGVPLDADLVFDVRCLPNPYYEADLRPLTGRDKPVQTFLAAIPEVGEMIRSIGDFIERWLPRYMQDGRSYLTVAVGCTGGQHRSVYCVEQLSARHYRGDPVLVRHRALDAKNPPSHPSDSARV